MGKWLRGCSYSKYKFVTYKETNGGDSSDLVRCNDSRWRRYGWPMFVQIHRSHELANINMKCMLTIYTILQKAAYD
jgi:hypothetical protein